MTPDVLHGLLWLARAGLRARGEAVHAGHGYADPNYRPPRLPYLSLTGPLDLRIEAERDPGRKRFVFVQNPGYLAGAERDGANVVPAPGRLYLRFDGDALATLDLDFGALAGTPFGTDPTGDAVAAAIQDQLGSATFTDEDGVPIVDPARSAELAAATVRWDPARRRLVVASGRRGVLSAVEASQPSTVEGLTGAADVAPALGLADPQLVAPGRLARHELPVPTAMSLDVRIDLWARSQSQLAVMSDAWSRLVPTRGEFLVRPGLLAEDAAANATEIRLQRPGEPRSPWSLVHLEGTSVDRVTGGTVTGGIVVVNGALRFDGITTGALDFYRLPPVPSPLFDDHPARDGYGLSLGVRTDPGGAVGEETRLVSLEHQSQIALRLALAWITDDQVALTGTAELAQAGVFGTATTTWRLPADRFDGGAIVHGVVDAAAGLVRLFVDGQPQPLQDTEQTPDPPVQVPGIPAGGTGMRLVLGDAGGADVGWSMDHLHLHGEPLGPIDPRLRTATSPASAYTIADPLTLFGTTDGVRGSGRSFTVNVAAVDGDRIVLDRPVGEAFDAGSTVVSKGRLFFSQKQIRRRDDLMNAIYRLSVDYKVSSFLEDRLGDLSAPLVESTDVIVRDLFRLQIEQALAAGEEPPETPGRPGQGAPGSASVDAPPAEPAEAPA